MPADPFDRWVANYLVQDAHEVARLIHDKTTIHFLVAWSLFETSCFGGEAGVNKFETFARTFIDAKKFQSSDLMDTTNHFHNRYQDKKLYRNLMHKQKSQQLESIRQKDFKSLSGYEIVYFVIFVVYRYRNNIFHGNKSVRSWLNFKPQIKWCIEVMQTFITFVEALHKAAKQGDADAQKALNNLNIDWGK